MYDLKKGTLTMNENSVICSMIRNNPDDWRELMTDKLIDMGTEGDLTIFNYQAEADFSDPVVREARGIIINTKKMEVVCWPFTKFGNYYEYYADQIDWESARLLEKIDGAIVKMWFDRQKGEWRFSTNKRIVPDERYNSIIKKIQDQVDFSLLDEDYTYILELVSPMAKVVIDYLDSLFYHIGTRNNKTGKSSEPSTRLPRMKK
ncbi:MAG: hypothetical protein E7294_05040 [Lachnospiraceae bacterium]|nr:hypothetical protein [Lachnospiraceae bacterium]